MLSQSILLGQTELKILRLYSFKRVYVASFQAKKESESMTGLADFDGNSVKLSWENFPDVGLSMVSERILQRRPSIKSTFNPTVRLTTQTTWCRTARLPPSPCTRGLRPRATPWAMTTPSGT